MKITYSVSKSDVYICSLRRQIGNRLLQLFTLCAWAFVFISVFNDPKNASLPAISKLMASTLAVGVVGIITLVCIVIMIGIQIGLQPLNGITCEHTLEIQHDGLLEETSVNSSLQKWGAFKSTIFYQNHILVRPNDSHVHIIPRREVEQDALEEFISKLDSMIEHSRQQSPLRG